MNETHRRHPFAWGDRQSWVRSLQPCLGAPLVRGRTKTCLNWRIGVQAAALPHAGPRRCRDSKRARSEDGLPRRVLAPFARRGAEPLLEDPAEVGEVVEAPCECDVADMPGGMGGVRQLAPASLQTLHLDIAAERGLFGGHQITGIARRDSDSR